MKLPLLPFFLAGFDTRFVLLIEGSGYGCRAAFLRQAGDRDNVAFLLTEDSQFVTALHGFGWLYALSVQLNMTAVNHLSGQSSRLEEASAQIHLSIRTPLSDMHIKLWRITDSDQEQ